MQPFNTRASAVEHAAAEAPGGPVHEPERIDEFFRYGMWLNVAAAMGVPDLSAGGEWIRDEQQESR